MLDNLSGEAITYPMVARVLDYWSRKCAGRPMPRRADVDPIELGDCLGNLCLVDVTSGEPRRFRFRVDGTKLASLRGFDLTAKFADQIPDPVYREFIIVLCERVVTTGAPVFVGDHEEWNVHTIKVSSVTLPLSNDGVRVDAILDAVFHDR